MTEDKNMIDASNLTAGPIDVSKLDVFCMSPAYYHGGTCDFYEECQLSQKEDCKAEPPKSSL